MSVQMEIQLDEWSLLFNINLYFLREPPDRPLGLQLADALEGGVQEPGRLLGPHELHRVPDIPRAAAVEELLLGADLAAAPVHLQHLGQQLLQPGLHILAAHLHLVAHRGGGRSWSWRWG